MTSNDLDFTLLIGYLETLQAILLLEYHDKNHLHFGTNPKRLNEEQRELVRLALASVERLRRAK